MARLFFLVCLLSPFFSKAQRNLLIPPSPEASSAFKFTEVPVSTYAGLVNTSIPLYEIKMGNVTVPIQLGYHARGIRVEEIASHVGIGWSLNYGGMISRQIRSAQDDAYGAPGSPNFYSTVFDDPAVAASVYASYITGVVDFDPDVYMFDLPGLSGKFMFDPRDRAILLQQYTDTKIVPVKRNDRMEGLIVTDKDGNKYYFGLSKDQLRSALDDDYVDNYSFHSVSGMTVLGASGSRPINTWHLMEIETVTNERIEFIYELETPFYYKRQYDDLVRASLDPNQVMGAISYFGKYTTKQYQISEIIFRGGKVKFTKASSEREDLPGAYALDKVEILDKNDSLIKGYSFQYQNSGTVQDDNQLAYLKNVDPSSNKRLFLKSIQEKGRNGAILPPYAFIYNNSPIPNRFSNSQDNWGFYNGKNNGQYLTFFQYGASPINREVDTVKSESGLLKKIIYPTGGSAEFTYEHNRGMPPVFMNKLLYPNNNPREIVPMLFPMMKRPQYYVVDQDMIGAYVREFQIGASKIGDVKITFELPHCGTATNDPVHCNYTVSLDGEGFFIPINLGSRTISIPPGTYRITVTPPAGHDPMEGLNSFYVKVEWNEERNTIIDEQSSLLFAAGKRIKKIAYKDQNGVAKMKEFAYTDPVTGKSSGKIFGLPSFYFIQKIIPGGTPIPVLDKYGSIPGSPLTNHQGNGIGYEYVTEYFGTQGTNTGKIEYKFTIPEDGGKFYEFPYTIPIDNEWLRGKSVYSKAYEKNSSGYSLQKETTHQYEYAGGDGSESIFFPPRIPFGQTYVYNKNRKRFHLPLLIFHKDTLSPFHYQVYYQSGGSMEVLSTTETTYPITGNALGQSTTNFYKYDNQYLPVRTESVDSKGDTLVSRIFFPTDLPSRTTAEQSLVDLHRIATPIRTESIVKAKTGGAELSKVTNATQFKNWGNNIITPELVQTATNNNPLETETQFISYDNNGNPTEVVEKDGLRVAYLWGYNNEYPVARVVGSDYNTVKGFVNLTMLANAYQHTDQQIRTELQKIRTGLVSTSASVTTYTYKQLVGMSSQSDANGRVTYYEYDGMARLSLVRDHDNNILKKISYDYAAPGVTYENVIKSGVFVRNNCGSGTGLATVYTVPAGTYTSLLNQADADQKAQDDVNANGQAFANNNGTCSFASVVKSGQFTRNNCGTGTGNTVTYTVNAGVYTSTISQADADQKAQNDVNTIGQAYANTNGICTFSSVAKSGQFTRNNCGSGTGSTVTYAVSAAAYSSTISQLDADQKAQNDVNTNGQAFANTNGICTFSSVAKSGQFTRNNCTQGTGTTVTYTVSAGAYTSTISQAGADQKAQDAVNANGQTYANNNGGCTQTVYAKITLQSGPTEFMGGCVTQYRHILVSFYSNATFTTPYSVTNLPIELKRQITQYNNGVGGTPQYTYSTYNCTGTSFTISNEVYLEGCASDCPPDQNCLPRPNDPQTRYVFSLVNSTFTINF